MTKREPWYLIPESAVYEIKKHAESIKHELRGLDSDYLENISEYVDKLLDALDESIEFIDTPHGDHVITMGSVTEELGAFIWMLIPRVIRRLR